MRRSGIDPAPAGSATPCSPAEAEPPGTYGLNAPESRIPYGRVKERRQETASAVNTLAPAFGLNDESGAPTGGR